MKPIGPLMWEHRLIERMVALLKGEIERVATRREVEVFLVEQAVDFFRTYADRTHHGKEEEILFRDLARKELSAEHRVIMDELIQEHIQGRQLVRRLQAAKDLYAGGDDGQLPEIASVLRALVAFYPAHIEKEDKRFFYPSLGYFSAAEQECLLEEFWTFDHDMIHEKYRAQVENLLGRKLPWMPPQKISLCRPPTVA